MAGDTQNGNHGNLRPDQPTTPHDPELARQARQAENRSEYHGEGLEPRDSRNVTGTAGPGTSSPGGADQQEGGDRWAGDAQQALEVAAQQPDATTAAGQQPGIDRRELAAEQHAHRPPPQVQERSEVWSGDAAPNPAAQPDPPRGASPEAQHLAAAHVPGHSQPQQGASPQFAGGTAQQQDLGVPQHSQPSMKQTMAGMSQSLGGGSASQQESPEQQGFVDQQAAAHGGRDPQTTQRMDRPASGQTGGEGTAGNLDQQAGYLGGIGSPSSGDGSEPAAPQSGGGGGGEAIATDLDQQAGYLGGVGGPAPTSQAAAGSGGQGGASEAGGRAGGVGSDGQLAATHGIDVAAEQPGTQATGAYDQQAQFAASGGQQGGSALAGQVREHMEVVGADGVHLGTVDEVAGDRIKLTKRDSDAGYEGGQHHGHHHYISLGLVAAVEGDRVRLSATAATAYAMVEEK